MMFSPGCGCCPITGPGGCSSCWIDPAVVTTLNVNLTATGGAYCDINVDVIGSGAVWVPVDPVIGPLTDETPPLDDHGTANCLIVYEYCGILSVQFTAYGEVARGNITTCDPCLIATVSGPHYTGTITCTGTGVQQPCCAGRCQSIPWTKTSGIDEFTTFPASGTLYNAGCSNPWSWVGSGFSPPTISMVCSTIVCAPFYSATVTHNDPTYSASAAVVFDCATCTGTLATDDGKLTLDLG